MQIVHAGVDSVYLTMKAVGPPDLMVQLAEAKARASKDRHDVSVEFNEVKGFVPAAGDRNGYPYVFNTGVLGARFMFRETNGQSEWDLLVKPYSTALLSLGFIRVVGMLFDTLAVIGVQVIETILNRIDYAIDVRADGFVIDNERFITHPRTKRRPFWGATDEYHPSSVFTGRRLESVTIG